MSIIGDGKYINYIGAEIKPEWHRNERFDYCEKPLREEESLADLFKNALKLFGRIKKAA